MYCARAVETARVDQAMVWRVREVIYMVAVVILRTGFEYGTGVFGYIIG